MDGVRSNEEFQKTAPPALSDAIEKIMANPELISMVASALGKDLPSRNERSAEPMPEQTGGPHASETAELPALVGALAPLLSGFGGDGGQTGSASKSDRACLLRALKPYLSRGRREAIEYMIRISEISEVLKRLQ